jgi:hypothetical protein
MYVKTFTVEQLYESLLIATNADKTAGGNYEQLQQQRQQWMTEFMRIFGGNDDSEPTLFSGTIPQALMLMNGDLVKQATSVENGGYLTSVLSNPKLRSDNMKIQTLYVSALGRVPSGAEYTKIGKLLDLNPNRIAAYQDLYWALLNSNEFVLNH